MQVVQKIFFMCVFDTIVDIPSDRFFLTFYSALLMQSLDEFLNWWNPAYLLWMVANLKLILVEVYVKGSSNDSKVVVRYIVNYHFVIIKPIIMVES